MATARQIAASDVIPLTFPGYIVGNWYVGANLGTIGAGAAPGAGSIRLYPASLLQLVTLNALGMRVTTPGAAGNVQAAIYANNPLTGRPTGTALTSTASMSTNAGASVNAAISLQLAPGVYWFASNCDNGTAVFPSTSSSQLFQASLLGSAVQSQDIQNGICLQGLSVAQTFGTWPDLTAGSFTEVTTGNAIPLVQFKIASVP